MGRLYREHLSYAIGIKNRIKVFKTPSCILNLLEFDACADSDDGFDYKSEENKSGNDISSQTSLSLLC